MDNSNDPPACISFLEISDENMIPTNIYSYIAS